MSSPRTVRVTRYVTPLREGGSLPAIVEADDDGMYVLKFRGAGQGPRALIAELVSGEIARALGLPVPEIVFAELDGELARTEPDPEIHALILDSAGLNVALDYLPGAVTYDPMIQKPDADLASRIVWFDAFVSNVDRTVKNSNMLLWHRRIWLIDHGATLYFHHAPDWQKGLARPRDPFPLIRQHVLLRFASRLDAVDAELAAVLNPGVIDAIVNWIPQAWLEASDPGREPGEVRAALAVIPLVCAGSPEAGPIGALSPRERFRWLVSPRSTVVQMSPVHTGRTSDPAACLDRLFEKLVRQPARS